MESYTVIRANRRTVGLRLDKDGRLVVRAPYCTSETEIRRIVEKESAWLAREHERFAARQAAHPEPDEAKRPFRRRSSTMPRSWACTRRA